MSIVKRLLWFVRDFFAVNWMTEKVQLKQIKEMQDITEIRAYCATLYITWFGKSRLLKSKSFVRCNDYDKIKIITESIRKLEVQKNCFCAHMSHLCFKDKSGFFHCVEYSADPQSKAIEIGGYIDNSGVLYDALQNAGLVGPPLTEQQNPNKPPHSK